MRTLRLLVLAAGVSFGSLAASEAQTVPAAGQQAPAEAAQPTRLPPEGSPPLVRFIELRFPTQGNVSLIEPQTYQYYIQTQPSRSSDGYWSPYDEQTVLEDFRRLWNTNFLDDLWIEVQDAPYPNGVIGKHIIYNMEERQRVRIVDYQGSDQIDRTKIEEALTEANVQIRLDSFIDPSLIQRVENVLREMLAAKGYQFAEVSHELTEIPGGPKLVNLTFRIEDGPQVKVREIDFVGNSAMSDGTLKRKMKETKEHWWLSFITGRGSYQEAMFAEDAERVVEHYRNNGYVTARVGQPEMEYLEDSADGDTRWIRLKIPVEEGRRYKVGDFSFDGNTVVKEDALRGLFDLEQGEFYSEKKVRKGLEKAQEVYGTGGYFEFTAFPDLQPRDLVAEANGAPAVNERGEPIVDVTMRIQEGKQYFINRITFKGNRTTHDSVIRRELRLYENGVFNTEALKYSVRRLNQLGYFQQLEPDQVKVEKVPTEENQVNVTLELQEQNRNQLTFGAGVSQFEGFFGQLSFQTANFMGRGETLSLAAQAGSRAHNYQVTFTEPFLFDRAITGGIDVYNRELRYPYQFTQAAVGGNLLFGFPVADFTRMFLNYSYEEVTVKELNEEFFDPRIIALNPFLSDSLLIGQDGRRTVSKITPSIVHNTVDNPIFPNTGRRLSFSVDLAGLGGNTNFINPRGEGIFYFQQSPRLTFGFRVMGEYITEVGDTEVLPIFEKLFLGGEYTIRGFDIRSIGPRDPLTGLVVGGNKSLLANVEYQITIAGPVRLVFFYDAGQVQEKGSQFSVGDFKTSTGAEVRFFMPVLNVPFRLIAAFNPQRDGVLDNRLQPQKGFTFRFAVGSTF